MDCLHLMAVCVAAPREEGFAAAASLGLSVTRLTPEQLATWLAATIPSLERVSSRARAFSK